MSLLFGRIIGHEKDRYRIDFENGVQLAAVLRGRLLHEALHSTDLPVVGDVVGCILSGEELAVIESIEPRRSLLTRKGAAEKGIQAIAANVDYVLIATSLNQDFNRVRLDRYLTLAWDSGALPVFILTKRDLDPEWERRAAEMEAMFPGVSVHAVEAGGDLSALASFVSEGKVSVVVGSSGVGKSTLINGLLGREILKTGGIRGDDDKGRHTTTSRSMWRAGSGWVIDTPGLRELQMLGHEEGLDAAFQDIADIASLCKFGNCRHREEPGCAILRALDEGSLERERWESFLKLERELAWQRRKHDPEAAAEERAKWKRIHRDQRRVRRFQDED
jgi:ribosome biogenesis GTPase